MVVTLLGMRQMVLGVAGGATCLVVVLCVTVASAQSRDTVYLDVDEADAASDAGGVERGAASSDAGSADAADQAGSTGIEVVRVMTHRPAVETPPEPPQNDRRSIVAQLTDHVTRCIATRTPDPGAANARFLYLLRDGRPHATLTTVWNAEPMYLDAFHARLIHAIGETRPVDLRTEEALFRECVEVVTLAERPVRTERVSFRIKAGADRFRVLDVDWAEL